MAMNRSSLLGAYEKLAALLGKLPGSLQEPIFRELEPIKQVFLCQRAPRVAVIGDATVELPSLINALAGEVALPMPLARGVWTTTEVRGAVEWIDLRSSGVSNGFPPDLYLYVAGAREAGTSVAAHAAQVLASAPLSVSGLPIGVIVLGLGGAEATAAALAGLSSAGVSDHVVFSMHLPRPAGDKVWTVAERAELGDRFCDYLPTEAQLEMARFCEAREAQARLAGMVLKSFGAMAGVIGMQPLPLADFPILLALQMFMVALIIHVSGRDFSLRLAGEFVASLGIGFGAGLAFRETARAAIKILPFWGHVISGGVAGAGTYALGRAAIAYFIEERRMEGWRRIWPGGRRAALGERA